MTAASVDVLRILVLGATIATSIAPILLLVLFVRDAAKGRLW